MEDRTNWSAMSEAIAERIARLEAVVVRRLLLAGEKCINEARMRGSYTDRTGNLRSSIGYEVVWDGAVVGSGIVRPTLNGAKAADECRAFLSSLATQHKDRNCLIVVAGKEYAAYVQNKGYDVLWSAETLGRQLMLDLAAKLRKGEAD